MDRHPSQSFGMHAPVSVDGNWRHDMSDRLSMYLYSHVSEFLTELSIRINPIYDRTWSWSAGYGVIAGIVWLVCDGFRADALPEDSLEKECRRAGLLVARDILVRSKSAEYLVGINQELDSLGPIPPDSIFRGLLLGVCPVKEEPDENTWEIELVIPLKSRMPTQHEKSLGKRISDALAKTLESDEGGCVDDFCWGDGEMSVTVVGPSKARLVKAFVSTVKNFKLPESGSAVVRRAYTETKGKPVEWRK